MNWGQTNDSARVDASRILCLDFGNADWVITIGGERRGPGDEFQNQRVEGVDGVVPGCGIAEGIRGAVGGEAEIGVGGIDKLRINVEMSIFRRRPRGARLVDRSGTITKAITSRSSRMGAAWSMAS
jgi:hypothetical protein